jgi:hypothetical protein
MASQVSLQELLLVLAVNDFSPAVINHEFLRLSGVIPESWELARQPVYSPQMVQLAFDNGLVLTVQPNRIILAESIEQRSLSELQLASFAQKLIAALPNLEFQAIGFNPTGHYAPAAGNEAVKQYFNRTLIAAGPWMNVTADSPRITLNFSYQLDRCPLNLTVTEAGLRQEDESVNSVVVFSGNFNYLVGGTTPPERSSQMLDYLQHWQADVQQYEQIVNQNFLANVTGDITAAPALLPAFS